MQNADLVIGHCGAGTILECVIQLEKPFVGVVNTELMENHQLQLAEAMEKEGGMAVVRELSVQELKKGIEVALNTKGSKLKKARNLERMWEGLVNECF